MDQLEKDSEFSPEDRFKIFAQKFADAWETERLLRNTPIIRNNWEYEVTPTCIYVYYHNRANMTAKLSMYKVWADDIRILELLRRILPDFLEYFNNNLDFVKGFKWL
jgi:hypothetical protein